MRRSVSSVACLAVLVAACGTAPAPAPEFAAAPAGETAPMGDVDRVFMRSDMVDYVFKNADGLLVKVLFNVSYSADAEHCAMVADQMNDNWSVAADCGRRICERAELFAEQGRIECEDEMCEQMTEVLFGADAGARRGKVERVIWKRLLMQ